MDLTDLLKQFKKLEPGSDYKERSRSLILGTAPDKRTLGEWILHNLGAAAALALASVFVFLILGGFSAWSFLSPNITALNIQSLRAEAQAIDIQIQLTNVGYTEGLSVKLSQSTAPTTAGGKLANETTTTQGLSVSAGATTTVSTTVSIDSALDKLSQ